MSLTRIRYIRTKILLMTISTVVSAFLLTGIIGAFALGELVQSFVSNLEKRNEDFLETISRNSERSKNRIVSFIEESTKAKGEHLIKKDSLLLRTPFLENSFNFIRSSLQSSFDFDSSILSASFIVVEGDAIKAWQYIDRQHPTGLALPILFDRKKETWTALADGKPVTIPDPGVKDILTIQKAMIRKIEVRVETGADSALVPAYEAVIPIYDGGPEDLQGLREDGEAIAYLRYIISLESLVREIKAEKEELASMVETQKRNSSNAMTETLHETNRHLSETISILLLTAFVVIALATATSVFLSRLLANPLRMLNDAADRIAKGDYGLTISVQNSDEIGMLGKSFEIMRVRVKDFTERLQDLVDERTAELNLALKTVTTQNQKIGEIMSNIDQGILMINDKLEIESEYSLCLKKLYKSAPDELAGMSAIRLFFEGSSEKSDAVHIVTEAIKTCLGEDAINWDLNEGQLPRRIRYSAGLGFRTYEFQWSPMIEGGIVRRLLVTVRDLTRELELEEKVRIETKKSDKITQSLSEILANQPNTVALALRDCHHRLEEIENSLFKSFDSRLSYVNLHTIKGTARSLGFRDLAQAAHEAETFLQDYLRSSVLHKEGFYQGLENVRSELDQMRDIATRILKMNLGDGTSSPQSLFVLLADEFREAERLCEERQLAIHGITVEDQILKWDTEFLSDFVQATRHALINSLDHGYFSPILAGHMSKEDKVCFSITASCTGQDHVLSFRDEGFGFDRKAIRKIAVVKGWTFETDQELLDILLQDGLSTASIVSHLSGRGVGLGAIRSFAEKWQGHVKLMDNQPRGSLIVVTIPRVAVEGRNNLTAAS